MVVYPALLFFVLHLVSPIRAAALPPPMKTEEKVEQGKGTADHLMPLGYLMFETRLEVL